MKYDTFCSLEKNSKAFGVLLLTEKVGQLALGKLSEIDDVQLEDNTRQVDEINKQVKCCQTYLINAGLVAAQFYESHNEAPNKPLYLDLSKAVIDVQKKGDFSYFAHLCTGRKIASDTQKKDIFLLRISIAKFLYPLLCRVTTKPTPPESVDGPGVVEKIFDSVKAVVQNWTFPFHNTKPNELKLSDDCVVTAIDNITKSMTGSGNTELNGSRRASDSDVVKEITGAATGTELEEWVAEMLLDTCSNESGKEGGKRELGPLEDYYLSDYYLCNEMLDLIFSSDEVDCNNTSAICKNLLGEGTSEEAMVIAYTLVTNPSWLMDLGEIMKPYIRGILDQDLPDNDNSWLLCLCNLCLLVAGANINTEGDDSSLEYILQNTNSQLSKFKFLKQEEITARSSLVGVETLLKYRLKFPEVALDAREDENPKMKAISNVAKKLDSQRNAAAAAAAAAADWNNDHGRTKLKRLIHIFDKSLVNTILLLASDLGSIIYTMHLESKKNAKLERSAAASSRRNLFSTRTEDSTRREIKSTTGEDTLPERKAPTKRKRDKKRKRKTQKRKRSARLSFTKQETNFIVTSFKDGVTSPKRIFTNGADIWELDPETKQVHRNEVSIKDKIRTLKRQNVLESDYESESDSEDE